MDDKRLNVVIPHIFQLNPSVVRCTNTTNVAFPSSQTSYPKRTISIFELEYIVKGSGAIVVNDVYHPVKEDTLFIRTPGMEAQGFLPYSGYCILWEDLFSGDGVLEGAELPCSISLPPHNPICPLFKNVYKHYLENDRHASMLIKADILMILYHAISLNALQQAQHISSAQLHIQQIQKLCSYVEDNIDRQMSLGELASVCQFSEGFLCRIFKQLNGTPLFTYINECRVQRARRLLIETDLPIKDICAQCGFENESYFYRIFKRHMQVTPNAYRALHRQPYE